MAHHYTRSPSQHRLLVSGKTNAAWAAKILLGSHGENLRLPVLSNPLSLVDRFPVSNASSCGKILIQVRPPEEADLVDPLLVSRWGSGVKTDITVGSGYMSEDDECTRFGKVRKILANPTANLPTGGLPEPQLLLPGTLSPTNIPSPNTLSNDTLTHHIHLKLGVGKRPDAAVEDSRINSGYCFLGVPEGIKVSIPYTMTGRANIGTYRIEENIWHEQTWGWERPALNVAPFIRLYTLGNGPWENTIPPEKNEPGILGNLPLKSLAFPSISYKENDPTQILEQTASGDILLTVPKSKIVIPSVRPAEDAFSWADSLFGNYTSAHPTEGKPGINLSLDLSVTLNLHAARIIP